LELALQVKKIKLGLSEDLYDDGYTNITIIDFSPTAT
jgi:hypothetical protein